MPYLKYRHIDIVLQTFKFVNIFFIQILQLFLSNFLVFSHSGIKSLQLDFLNLDSCLRSPNYNNDNNALKANRGNYVNNNNVNNNNPSQAADLP